MGRRRINLIILFVFIAFFILINFSRSLVTLLTDWWWFKQVGYSAVFLGILKLKILTGAISGFIFFIFLYSNLLIAKKLAPPFPYWYGSQESPLYNILRFIKSPAFMRFFNLVLLTVALIAALGIGVSTSTYWDVVLKYINQTAFGVKDPVFGLDISFHMFSIPFFRGLARIGLQALIIAIILTGLLHWINGGITFRNGTASFSPRTKAHLSVLLGLLFVLIGISYKLSTYNLLQSGTGVIYGAGYTDIHAKLPALNILFYSSLIAGVLSLVNIYFRGWKLPAGSLAFIIAMSILAGSIYPAIVQQYVVSPNEIEKETPYIKQAIKFTNLAYGLDKIKEKPFSAEQALDKTAIRNNKQTIDNIRLWDWKPLEKTFKQIQSIRLYYDFMDVDVDRYLIDGDYRQVAVSARELNTNDLPDNAKTWVNQHLVYTHGYGVIANKVNEFTDDGLPNLIIKDIPPKTSIPNLKIKRPEIYFGEATDNYIIVHTKTREFDYPMGNENKYTKYEGKDGVKLGSFFKEAAFAFRFSSLKLLLSSAITDNSRIIFNRNVVDRANTIAPFLSYENDPYIVIDEGKLYWIIDGFTSEKGYPYSEPFDGENNYIRNSVKVVVDAYNGDVNYYVFDKKDPVIQTYRKAFPGLFKDSSEMPAGLTKHIRYPESLFVIQSNMYTTFHMKDPQVFYNKEDLWNIPKEIVEGKEADVEPYYMVIKLPGEEKEKFMMMTPFTPVKKSNMIAWMAAKCEPEEYGQILVYRFPKQKLIYGPMQIEARIDQTPNISQELTLWNQRGSRVIRGNLFVIPIEDSLLYVEPLYLQSEQTELPELKRVIVAYGSKIVMENNLESALEEIFGKSGAPAKPYAPKPTSELTPSSIKELIEKASSQFEAAQNNLREGNWAGYGEEMNNLQDTLARLKEQVSK
ncbi:MAG: UPF0182 family protein [Actinomycetota bacterium]